MNTIYVIGIGPGAYEKMTLEAVGLLEETDIIIGYTLYIDIIKEYFKDKIYIDTPMRKEEERCRIAFEKAKEGYKVALISSGDAGVYGMAVLMLAMSQEYEDCKVEVIPGVTAALAGAAVLGAPLTHDFAVISLSDLMTPWEKIEKRILLAAEADFVICIYNPASKKRREHLKKACDLLLLFKDKNTPCAVVKNIAREGEKCTIMPLKELRDYEADMFSTVYVGNAETKRVGERLLTPRGYRTTR